VKKGNNIRHINGEKLRELLYRQAKAVSDEAIHTNGQVRTKKLEEVERLARLVEICASIQSPARKRWLVVALLAITLLIASLLHSIHVPETEIELDIALSEVSWVSPERQVLADAIRLSELGISGLHKIRLPRARAQAGDTLHACDVAASAIHLSSVSSNGQHQGIITLGTLTLPAGARVWLRHMEVPHRYQLSLKGEESPIRADVMGMVHLGLSGISNKKLDFLSPSPILLQPDSNELDFDLTFPDASKSAFSSQLFATNLFFFRIDQFMDTNHTVIQRVSTILHGKLYLESLNGRELILRPGEAIQFQESYGQIRTLRLHDDHISLKFHGRVSGMTSGGGRNERNLMPTYLDWIRERHVLALLWGTTVSLFGLFVAVLRWWTVSG